MDIRKDIIGNIPQIGDLIVFNPPAYKGLVYGRVCSFSKAGLPEINARDKDIFYFGRNKDGNYSPKTGFAIIKEIEDND